MHASHRAVSWPQWTCAGIMLALLLWAAGAPLRYSSRELLVEVKPGAVREVRLTLGAQDVLLLRNSDTRPLSFGPVQIKPGQDFRLPFDQAATLAYGCSACAGGQMVVTVVPLPDPGWERLRWRVAAVVHAIRFLPRQGPANS